jgi:putative polyhydroxyalkanoate system protein
VVRLHTVSLTRFITFIETKEEPMPDIHIVRPHQFPPKEARAKAEEMTEHLGQKFGLKGNWAGDKLVFTGPGVNGVFTLKKDSLELEVTLGFLLKAMRGNLEKAVNSELDKLFAASAPAPAKKVAAAPKVATKAPAAKAPAAKAPAKKAAAKSAKGK